MSCDAHFAFGEATYSADEEYDYDWSDAGLYWSAAGSVKVKLAMSAVSNDATLSGLRWRTKGATRSG